MPCIGACMYKDTTVWFTNFNLRVRVRLEILQVTSSHNSHNNLHHVDNKLDDVYNCFESGFILIHTTKLVEYILVFRKADRFMFVFILLHRIVEMICISVINKQHDCDNIIYICNTD